jgi:hypothetical protein
MGEQGMDSGDLEDLHNRAREAADPLQAKASGILELAERLERLTEDTPT